jgi:hypothetical protein
MSETRSVGHFALRANRTFSCENHIAGKALPLKSVILGYNV